MAVSWIIASANATTAGLTSSLPKEADFRIGRSADRVAPRVRSTTPGTYRAAKRTASSAGFCRISPSGERGRPSAAEEISPTPTICRPVCGPVCGP